MKIIQLLIIAVSVKILAFEILNLTSTFNADGGKWWNITLICTVLGSSNLSNVSFTNPKGEVVAHCEPPSVENKSNCTSYKPYAKITQDSKKKETSLILHEKDRKFHGSWGCTNGHTTKETTIPQKRGIRELLKVNLNVTIRRHQDWNSVDIICSANFQNLGTTVHIKINNETIDYVRYAENDCYHQSQKCSPAICKCSPSSNIYEWYGNVTQNISSVSCVQDFKDNLSGEHFPHTETKNISEQPVKGNKDDPPEKSDEENTKQTEGSFPIGQYTGWIVAGVVALVLIFFVVYIITTSCKKKKNENETAGEEENLELMSGKQETVSQLMVYKSDNSYSVDIPELIGQVLIRGVALLKDKLIVVIYHNNDEVSRLMVFNNDRNKHLDLKSNPRGMTKISDDKVAISFDSDKTIMIFQVDSFNLEERSTINVDRLGRPHSITYDKETFAVEYGERALGDIAVISIDGTLETKLGNKNKWSFTGNTIQLALDAQMKIVYVSSLTNSTIYQVNYESEILLNVKAQVPSLRDILYIPSLKTLFMVSENENKIYAIGDADNQYEVLNENDVIRSPYYISNLYSGNDLFLCTTNGNQKYHVQVQEMKYGNKKIEV